MAAFPRYLLVLLVLLGGSPLLAQDEPAVNPGFESPRATVKTFLEAMTMADVPDWQRAASCFDLSSVGKDQGRDVAENMKAVLDRLEFIDFNDTHLPAKDAAAALTRFTYYPHAKFTGKVDVPQRIELTRSDTGEWRFSAATADTIHDFYVHVEGRTAVKGVVDIATKSWRFWLRGQMPASLKGPKHTVINVEYWQWIGLLVVIFVGLVVDTVFRLFLRSAIGRFIKRQGATENVESIRFTVRPIGLVIAAITWVLLLRLIGLPPGAAIVLIGAAKIFGILAGTWGAWRLTDLAGEVLIEKAKHTETKLDDVLIPLVRKTVKIFIIVIALIYSAAALNIELMPLLASLGIGGVAFAFAAKDTVENFFGSVAVLLDRPFEVGDWVVIGSDEGTVEEIGFRSTRIRTFYNSQITVPNSNLVKAVVDNYGRREYRRWKTHIGVQYDTTPEQLVAFTEGIRELVRCHPYTRKDYFNVFLHEFANSSLNILVYVFWKVPDWPTELRERERLFIDIVRLADQLGVQFAFPTQTVHLYQEQHTAYQQQHQPPAPTTDATASADGIRAAQHIIAQQPWQQERPGKVEYHTGPTPVGGDAADGDQNADSGS